MFYHVILERVRVPKILPSLNEARCVGAFGCLDLIDPKTGEPLGDLWWLMSSVIWVNTPENARLV